MIAAPIVISIVPPTSGRMPKCCWGGAKVGDHSVPVKNSLSVTCGLWKNRNASRAKTTMIPAVVTTEISAQRKQSHLIARSLGDRVGTPSRIDGADLFDPVTGMVGGM